MDGKERKKRRRKQASKAFAAFLEELRIQNGESRTEQAERIGVSLAEISKLTHGHRGVTVKSLERISNAYKLTAEEYREMYIASIPLDVWKAIANFESGKMSKEELAVYLYHGVKL
jgi:transcriptional regulator with XRE-family HTH domain